MLSERQVCVLTALDSYCTTDQAVKAVFVSATLDKTAQELTKDLKKLVLGNNTNRYHNFM